jgi:hypothetical protein
MYRTNRRSRACANCGGNYGGGSDHTDGRSYGRCIGRGGEEEALPEPVPPTAQEPAAKTTAVFTDIQISIRNLGERIPIAPQVWDADTR